MITCRFRYLAAALAVLGPVALRLARLVIGSSAASPPGAAADGQVVFRHYV